MEKILTLGIESSCDETSVSVDGDSIRKHFSEKISAPFDLDAGLELSRGMKKLFPWVILESLKILQEWKVVVRWKRS